MMSHPISSTLATWYNKNKRDLPWRNISNPYYIWLSEIILQQTQVVQGMSYYLKFIDAFPTIDDLANAPEDTVLKLWQGLGYYSRARNLHAAAKYVRDNHHSKFPSSYENIKELKGVGDYTAAAISSFAFGLPYAVVDGNVYRVLSRLFNLNTPINSSLGKKEFQLLADELLNQKQPALHNSAMMEFGALYCKPKNPKCEECVLQTHCLAFQNKTVLSLPIKIKAQKIKNRYFNYVIFNYKECVYIQQRTTKDIWQNLYEFYLIESNEELNDKQLLNHSSLDFVKKQFTVTKSTTLKKHILSHQHIYSTFYEVELLKPIKAESLIKIKKTELEQYGLPQLIVKYNEL